MVPRRLNGGSNVAEEVVVMASAPRERSRGLSRREFLRRSLGTAVVLPSAAAILAACSKPGTTSSGGTATGGGERVLARPDNPVTLPMNGEPIPTSTPIETGTLRVYNWDAYMYKPVLKAFEDKYGVTVEWTTFQNMEEGIQKLVAGQVQADVFFPTTDYVSRLVEGDLLQPLNHELIPNLEANMWKVFSDPGPYYDLGWRYTVPYTIYTTGVAYRRDRIDDAAAADAGYDLFFDPIVQGRGELLRLLPRRPRDDAAPRRRDRRQLRRPGRDRRREGRDPADDQRQRRAAHDQRHVREAARGRVQRRRSPGRGTSSARSGTCRRARPRDVLGYWYPPDKKGLVGNDTIAIPADAPSPRLAHEFLNFFLDEHWGYVNFADWNGYQPPMNSIEPDRLVQEGVVPPSLADAVLDQENFTLGYIQGELSAAADALWLDAWSEIQAGG